MKVTLVGLIDQMPVNGGRMKTAQGGLQMTKTEKKPVIKLAIHHPSDLKGKNRLIGGSMSDGWNKAIADQVVNTLWTKHLEADEANDLRAAAVEALIGIKSPATTPRWNVIGAPCCRILCSTSATAISIQRTSYRGHIRRCSKLLIATEARARRKSQSSTSTFTKAAKP